VEVGAARLAEAIDLLPVGGLPSGTLERLAVRLSRHVALACYVRDGVELAMPRIPNRDQLDANALVEALEARAGSGSRLVVGIVAADLAVPLFTHVFGLARSGGRACVVSLARADPGFYGLPPDAELRDARAVAEVLHELGHLAAVEHCPDRGCLMSFAGNIERVDSRGTRFCPACLERLPEWLRGPAALRETV
jgi:archaemetzincin